MSTTKGEYAAPEISVIEVKGDCVICISFDFGIPEDTGYDYFDW